jgi:hypothetical protein
MTEEIEPLLDFLKAQTEKTWAKSLEREQKCGHDRDVRLYELCFNAQNNTCPANGYR